MKVKKELIDGKARTAKQWRELEGKSKTKLEERKKRNEAGICSKCGKGAFRLKYVNRELIRECKTCGEELIV